MAIRKRKYYTNLVKNTICYTTEDIAELFNLHKCTVRHWLKICLIKIDKRKPYMVHGTDLIHFIKSQKEKKSFICKFDELPCFRCRKPRKPKRGEVILQIQNSKKGLLKGNCNACGSKMNKAVSMKNIDKIMNIFDVIKTQEKNLKELESPVLNTHLREGNLHD